MNNHLYKELARLRLVTKRRGLLLPLPFVATLLGLSRQRVSVLVAEGRLERVDVGVQPFVTERSLLNYTGQGPRKPGPPIGEGGRYAGLKKRLAAEGEGECGPVKEMSEAEWQAQFKGIKPDKGGGYGFPTSF